MSDWDAIIPFRFQCQCYHCALGAPNYFQIVSDNTLGQSSQTPPGDTSLTDANRLGVHVPYTGQVPESDSSLAPITRRNIEALTLTLTLKGNQRPTTLLWPPTARTPHPQLQESLSFLVRTMKNGLSK
jgi:hypothetical protein